jgi:hypothetical protein
MNRPLSLSEQQLIRWMLDHGGEEAREFLPQVDRAEASPEKCPCGCASIDLSIDGLPKSSGKLHVLADYLFGTADHLNGIFVFQRNGMLAGLEVYGLTGDAPKSLPLPSSLRPYSE